MLSKLKAGIFQMVELSPGRWEVCNALTGGKHITYGTASEVERRAVEQTEAWQQKRTRKGTPWRYYKL